MNAFTAGELAAMRATQTGAMMDTCTLRVWAPVIDSYGTETEAWTSTANVACGLDVSKGAREMRRPDGTITTVDGVLRLSMVDGASLTAKDSVIVTKRNGEAVSLTYGIAGPVQRGPTGFVVQLQAVK